MSQKTPAITYDNIMTWKAPTNYILNILVSGYVSYYVFIITCKIWFVRYTYIWNVSYVCRFTENTGNVDTGFTVRKCHSRTAVNVKIFVFMS